MSSIVNTYIASLEFVGEEDLEKVSVFLTGQLLVLVGGESEAEMDLPAVLLFPGVGFLQVPPAAHPTGRDVLQRDLHTPQQLVADLTRGGVERLLYELPQTASVLHLVDLVEFLVDRLLGVEVPDVQSEAVLVYAVDVPARVLS